MLVGGEVITRPVDMVERIYRVRTDPWYFLSNAVWTQDQADQACPIKKFPTNRPYLKLYSGIWLTEPLIVVPKSRRMFMSWVNIALYLWDAMWHIGKSEAFVSKKEDDSADLVARANFIYEHIPTDPKLDWYLPKELIPKRDHVFGKLRFPEINSDIRAFAQGQDQMRQFTFSGMLLDELAFWPDAQKTYAASIPTLEGGGRCTAISSPAPGFFKRLVFDQLEEDRNEDAT